MRYFVGNKYIAAQVVHGVITQRYEIILVCRSFFSPFATLLWQGRGCLGVPVRLRCAFYFSPTLTLLLSYCSPTYNSENSGIKVECQ